jgi:hypothetical protein
MNGAEEKSRPRAALMITNHEACGGPGRNPLRVHPHTARCANLPMRIKASTSADVIAAVRQLVLIADDNLIAGILNRNGLVTGYGNRWTRERVTSLRSHHRIAVYKPADDELNRGSTSARQRDFCMLRPKPSGWPWRLARSKRFILCRTASGSSIATFSLRRQLVQSRNAHARTQSTPRDRIPISKACSLQ